MVNPLPVRNLNWQTFKQKVQELFQLLIDNPVRILLTLLLTRGLWIPLLKMGKLPPRLQVIIWNYLEETLELIVDPLAFLLQFAFRALSGALARPFQLVRVLD